MTIKFASQTPYTIMNGFPVLRMATLLRDNLIKVLEDNKPESMLFLFTLHLD